MCLWENVKAGRKWHNFLTMTHNEQLGASRRFSENCIEATMKHKCTQQSSNISPQAISCVQLKNETYISIASDLIL